MKTAIKQYEINGVHQFTEEDTYNEGCQPNSGNSGFLSHIKIKADTVEELIKKLFSELCFKYDKDAMELDACDEDGRIDISVMEDENGSEATASELKAWKEGNKRLWSGIYTAHVELVERQTVSVR